MQGPVAHPTMLCCEWQWVDGRLGLAIQDDPFQTKEVEEEEEQAEGMVEACVVTIVSELCRMICNIRIFIYCNTCLKPSFLFYFVYM